MNAIQSTARHLSSNFIWFELGSSRNPCPCEYCEILRNTGRKVNDKYDTTLNVVINDFLSGCSNDDDFPEKFRTTLIEITEDDVSACTWGRVVMVYVFAARLAKRYSLQRRDDRVDELIDMTGNYVAENLSLWIEQQNGWVRSCLIKSIIKKIKN